MRILAVVSLVLMIGGVALWVRSVRFNDALTYRTQDDTVTALMSVPHGLCLNRRPPPRRDMDLLILAPPRGLAFDSRPWGRSTTSLGGGAVAVHITTVNSWYPPANASFGFGWERRRGGLWTVVVPLWIIVILFSVLPVVWIRRERRDRMRRAQGLCAHCGYDLRATPGRCPECGRDAPRVAGDVHPTTTAVESVHH
jgi:hypothetical protein